MYHTYPEVTTRFLNKEERLICSEEKEMPLVIEANQFKDKAFLHRFLNTHSASLLEDIGRYGAVLLRGFEIQSDHDFEKAILAMKGFNGIKNAFMSEEGRIHPAGLDFVLHTNAVYKTGGTLYLGGFHSENYYSPDVPAYICFCCLHPSTTGGETGLINMEKVYAHLAPSLQKKLEEKPFFVTRWLVSEVMERYQLNHNEIEALCSHYSLPLVGTGKNAFILMYKPSVFIHPLTKKGALQLNFFELPRLNKVLRQYFNNDYQGSTWRWHRFVWRWPSPVFKLIERLYIMFASFFYSPKEALSILRLKIRAHQAASLCSSLPPAEEKVGIHFQEEDIHTLAQLMRQYYVSCLWQKGDILLVDNRKVVHAGMPGTGPRLVRAMIGNPLNIRCSPQGTGIIACQERPLSAAIESLKRGGSS